MTYLRTVVVTVAMLAISEHAPAAQRPFAVPDYIGMTRITESVSSEDGRFALSPDGRWFVIVTSRGNLTTGLIESSLLRYDVGDLVAFVNTPARTELPKAEVLATFTGRREGAQLDVPPLSQLQWWPDSRRLSFLGRGEDTVAQVYVLDVESLELEQLTHHPISVIEYEISPETGRLTFGAYTPPDTRERNLHGYAVEREHVYRVAQPELAGMMQRRTQFVMDLGSGVVRPLDLERPYWVSATRTFTPSGRSLVSITNPQRIPAAWTAYDFVRRLYPHLFKAIPGRPAPPKEGFIVDDPEFGPSLFFGISQAFTTDLASGTTHPLLDAPFVAWEPSPMVAWTADEKRLAVGRTYLPLPSCPDDERTRCLSQPAVVEVEGQTGKASRVVDAQSWPDLARQDIRNIRIRWRSDNELLVQVMGYGGASAGAGDSPLSVKRFKRRSGRWSEVSGAKADLIAAPTLRFRVVEDMNTPPELTATDPKTNNTRTITDLNPQLRQLELGRGEKLSWTDRLGGKQNGVLLRPANFGSGERYPVVIRLGTGARLFDLSVPTANSLRALLGKDILVLGASCDGAGARQTGRYEDDWELPRITICVESAIDALDAQGLIDRNRVGLMGFSGRGMSAMQVVTFGKYPIAAATLADSTASTPWIYAGAGRAIGHPGMTESFVKGSDFSGGAALIGAPLWGEGTKPWLERSPFFNLDRIRTALRFEFIGTRIPEYWDVMSILKNMHRPAEMIHIPQDVHALQTPYGQFTSQQGNLDWYAFWLKDEERTDPIPGTPETAESLKAQYARWRSLREQQVAALREPRPPANRMWKLEDADQGARQ